MSMPEPLPREAQVVARPKLPINDIYVDFESSTLWRINVLTDCLEHAPITHGGIVHDDEWSDEIAPASKFSSNMRQYIGEALLGKHRS